MFRIRNIHRKDNKRRDMTRQSTENEMQTDKHDRLRAVFLCFPAKLSSKKTATIAEQPRCYALKLRYNHGKGDDAR